MWWEDVIAAYHRAYDEFVARNPGKQPHTWELDFRLEGDLLQRACEATANEIEHTRSPLHPEAATVLLKALLTGYLSDVHANRLWPAVSAYVSSYSRRPCTPERVAQYFRYGLQRIHFRELPQCHHRYVVFLMQDTGAGLHTDGIQEYLLDLVKAYRRELGRVDIESFLARTRGQGEADSEQELISTALDRTSRTLLSMVDYATTHEIAAPAEVWEAHRDFWRRALGVELERLLPNAERRLMPALRYIGNLLPMPALNRSRRPSRVRVIVGHRPVSPGVVVVHRSGERLEILGASRAPNVSPSVRLQRLAADKSSRYRLSGWPQDRPVEVEVDGHRWTVVNVQAIRLECQGAPLAEWSVRIQGDNCTPILGDRPSFVQVAGSFQGVAEEFSLWGVEPTGRFEIGRGMVHEIDGRELGSGPLVVQLYFRDVPLPVTQVLYLFQEAPSALQTHLGDYAVLRWQERGGNWVEARSQHPVSLAAVQENKQAIARYEPEAGSEWSLQFAWKPPVHDVWLEVDGQALAFSSRIKASAVQQGLQLCFTHAESPARIEVDGQEVFSPEDVMASVSGALAAAHEEIVLSVECAGVIRQWSIDATPEVVSFSGKWDGDYSVLGELSWLGTSRVPTVEANGQRAQVLSVTTCGPAGALGIHRYLARLRWSDVISEGTVDEVTLALVQGSDRRVLASLPVPDALLSHPLRERVLALASAAEEVQQAWELVYLNERYARLEGNLPTSVDSQIAAFQRRGCHFQEVFQCLRLLDAIVRKSSLNTLPLPPDHFGPNARSLVFYLTLLAIAQARLRVRGLARPAMTEALVRAFERYQEDSAVGWWSRAMTCYSAGLPPHECRSRLRGLDPPTVPLVLCAPELRDWWDAVNSGLHLSGGDEITRWTPSQR